MEIRLNFKSLYMVNWQQNKKIIITGIILVIAVGWYLYKTSNPPVIPFMQSQSFQEDMVGSAEVPAVARKGSAAMPGAAGNSLTAPLAYDAAGVPESLSEVPTADARKVVQSGTLDLVVNKAEEAATQAQALAQQAGGFVESLQIYEVVDGQKSGSVIIRVPANKFRETMDSLKALAINTENEVVNTQDVTAQYVDIEARLKNMRAEEVQYLSIMERAVKIEDVLNVTQRLSDVRGRIEQLEAQLKLLKAEVEMSSIVVNLTAEGDIEVFGIHWRPLVVIRQAFRDMLKSLAAYADQIIKFVFALPVILLWIATWGVGLLIAWKVGNRIKQRWFDKDTNIH
ncbi:MAG: hypothetical protein A3E37_02485 [Candidatus Andersenbacteria bacterium RIFCSPHIGHO2_12_FULL_46_9]|nr:MAG: hypothetical protein A3B76_03415 [Candidatus Andersenbacteria bacterium RIFCSPHIGHO2_02_FULL_46_16]OGY37393.1 MAG: hypothetical protein A3E37_02485 [Candidatus Andersenbacteria bacterium RIFCSPHIGHO2_12_FULL_46_9]HBE89757.1 hypothetical protein [Candidatus Andersenbacteria bacterium]